MSDTTQKEEASNSSMQDSEGIVSETGPIQDSEKAADNAADSSIVDWDGPNDTANPLNWTVRRRWANIVVVSILGLVTNLAPTMCAPGAAELAADLNITSETVSTLAVTLYVLGIALGPMVISPLSEVYGRLIVYHATNLVFLAFVIGSALSTNVAQFMVFRFISGCAGGTPMALGAGSIADLTLPTQRSWAMTLFSLGPLTGPVLGPVVGGFVAASKGWRWTFWVLAAVAGGTGVTALVVLRETHPRILLERKAARLRKSTGNPDLRSKLTLPFTPAQMLKRALIRPAVLLVRSPILLVLSLYVGLVFGILYLLFTTFTTVFEGQYGFSTAVSGLAYLGLGVALVLGVVVFNVMNKSMMARLNGKPPRPEQRLLPMIWFSPFSAVGLFIYGWTAQYRVHWIAPVFGTVFIGYGAFFVLMPVQLYLVDLFGSTAAASALGANLLLRYILGTFLPLAGPSMYKTLGYGWGNSLLGFLALAFVPFPILFYKYGEWLRAKTTVSLA